MLLECGKTLKILSIFCYFLLFMIVTAIARLSGLLWNKAERSACSAAVDPKATAKDNGYDEL